MESPLKKGERIRGSWKDLIVLLFCGGLGIELGLDTMITSYLQQDSRSTEILFLLKLRIKKK